MVYRNRNTTTSRNSLSDRDMLLDLLATGKNMSHLYDHAIMESSNSMIRDTFEILQHDEHLIGKTLFGVMEQEGWYSTGAGRQNSGQKMGNPQRQTENLDTQSGSRYVSGNSAQRSGGNLAGRGQSSRGSRSLSRSGTGSQMEWTL
jgi:hypothetical protein